MGDGDTPDSVNLRLHVKERMVENDDAEIHPQHHACRRLAIGRFLLDGFPIPGETAPFSSSTPKYLAHPLVLPLVIAS